MQSLDSSSHKSPSIMLCGFIENYFYIQREVNLQVSRDGHGNSEYTVDWFHR